MYTKISAITVTNGWGVSCVLRIKFGFGSRIRKGSIFRFKKKNQTRFTPTKKSLILSPTTTSSFRVFFQDWKIIGAACQLGNNSRLAVATLETDITTQANPVPSMFTCHCRLEDLEPGPVTSPCSVLVYSCRGAATVWFSAYGIKTANWTSSSKICELFSASHSIMIIKLT